MDFFLCVCVCYRLEERTDGIGDRIRAWLLAIMWLTLAGVEDEVFDAVGEVLVDH